MTRGFQNQCLRLLVKICYSAVGADLKEEVRDGEVYLLIVAQQFVIYFVT